MDDNRNGDQASKAASDLKESIAGAVEKASDSAGTARTTAAEAACDYLSQTIAEQPLLALLIAAAVGYGIAYLVLRR